VDSHSDDRDGGRLRVALLSPPLQTVPPARYGGTERIVAALAEELHRRGHDVTVFASGDSNVSCRVVPVTPRAVWATGFRGDAAAFFQLAAAQAWRRDHEFDVIHSHLEIHGFLLARYSPTPVVTTLHGRLDGSGIDELLDAFPDIPLISISDSQRRWAPDANWLATVPHGLPMAGTRLGDGDGGFLLFVGRVAVEKGVPEAIELARRTQLPLKMAAKIYEPREAELFEHVVRPAIEANTLEFLGEIDQQARDALFGRAIATLMLGAWPEPFGLVAIESLACGTPVIARRVGALPEIIEHGIDGFLVDDLDEARLATQRVTTLDRGVIRRRALDRFSVERMTDRYESIYAQLVAGRPRRPRDVRLPVRAIPVTPSDGPVIPSSPPVTADSTR
jgi:glycosyltransferase involved in cell wall biosynthesis